MTGASSFPIRVRPGSSRQLGLGLALAHLGALPVLWSLTWPWWARLAWTAAVLASLCWSWSWHVLHRGDAVVEVLFKPEGEWWITTAKQASCLGTLLPGGVVQPWLTVLVFRLADGRRRAVVLLADNVDPDGFRRLRVQLRYPRERPPDAP